MSGLRGAPPAGDGDSKRESNSDEARVTVPPGTVRSGAEVAPARAADATDRVTPEPTVHTPDVSRLKNLASMAEARMRFGRALDLATTVTAGSLLGAAVAIAAAKTAHLSDPAARRWLIAFAIAPFVGFVIGWARRLPKLAGAIALDKDAGLNDRVATALAFAEQEKKSEFMQAAIADGVAHAKDVKPSRAVPIPVPRDVLAVMALAAVVAFVSLLEVRKHLREAQAPTINALEMDPDDLDALQDFANQLKDQPHADDDMKAAVQDFNKLVEDLKNKRIDRNEAFRRMAELDVKLQKSSQLDKKALDEAMKKLGNELKKNENTKEIGAALEKGDKKEAEKKLKELSEALKTQKLKLNDEQKKQLADALKKAANRDREKSLAEMKEKREKLLADMEKARAEKEKNGGKETPEQEKDRKDKERQLEKLEREEKEMSSADRQLDKLDKDLEQAAADIMKDLGLSAEDLGASAEDIQKMAQDDMTAEEKEELRQRLKELHDLLVQQGKLTPEQIAKLKEFMKKAKGGKGGKGKGKKNKGKGSGMDPNGDPNGGGNDKGDDKGDDGDGDGDDGDGPGKGMTLGPDGKPIPVPGAGGNQPGPGMGGAGQNGGPAGDGKQPGPGWGVGHDPKMLGKKTANKVGTTDIQVAGQNAGAGKEYSKTILGAADKGFVGKKYKAVYDDYKAVAEEALKQDEIPNGYRFYVRRYFDLIRPRE